MVVLLKYKNIIEVLLLLIYIINKLIYNHIDCPNL